VSAVILPGGTGTTRLGFGCSRLAGGLSAKESNTLLNVAFDAGIRHFDVAPSYGLGAAESVLGSFLARHRGSVTVTTKFGIPRPSSSRRSALQTARSVLKPIVERIPGLKERLLRALHSTSPPIRFSARELRQSLEVSLRDLRCARIDLFLLHEAQADDVTDDLCRVLDDSVARGSIGAWGFGGVRERIDGISRSNPGICRVLQFEWSILAERMPAYPGAFVITYQSLASPYERIVKALADPLRRRAWSEAVGLDLGESGAVARLMLASAIISNPAGIVLVSSKSSDRIRENAAVMENLREDTIHRFMAVVAQERANLPL
jgi:D-threo-aldose 1-dehydrogenase